MIQDRYYETKYFFKKFKKNHSQDFQRILTDDLSELMIQTLMRSVC